MIDDIKEEGSSSAEDVLLTSEQDVVDNSPSVVKVTGVPKETAKKSKAEDGLVEVTYLGGADRVDIAQFVFRPGVPVEVPSDIAEELLTFPFEEFKVKE